MGTLRGHVKGVYLLAWSADSRLLVSCSGDSTVKGRYMISSVQKRLITKQIMIMIRIRIFSIIIYSLGQFGK